MSKDIIKGMMFCEDQEADLKLDVVPPFDRRLEKLKHPPSWKKSSIKGEDKNGWKPLVSQAHVPEDCIRFVCISDTHSRVEKSKFISYVPDGDVLLHAGDFTRHGEIVEYLEFNKFLERLPHSIKIAIPGNHEVSLDPRGLPHNVSAFRKYLGLPMCLDQPSVANYRDVVKKLTGLVSSTVILTDSFVSVCGIKIYGMPWHHDSLHGLIMDTLPDIHRVPVYGAPGFGLERGEEMEDKVNLIPTDTDILLSHGPPHGFGDFTIHGKNVGCSLLSKTVKERVKPRYLVSGHIHEGYGVCSDGTTTYINAAICNRRYQPVREPIVFDYHMPPSFSRNDFLKLRPDDLAITHTH